MNSKRILLAEDNEDLALLIAEHLTDCGHSVVVAHDGPTALELSQSFEPEFAILDMGLPGFGGYELAQALHGQGSRNKVRLFAVTGRERDQDRARARAAGFEKYFVKPVLPEALEKAIAEAGEA